METGAALERARHRQEYPSTIRARFLPDSPLHSLFVWSSVRGILPPTLPLYYHHSVLIHDSQLIHDL